MTSQKSPPEQPIKVSYTDRLDPITLARYREKIKLVDHLDPYEVKKSDWRSDPDGLPDVTYPDIVNYLVHTQSAYTLQDLKAYKSLESYNQFFCGWVKDVGHISSFVTKNILMSAKVRHSQRMNEAPLQPWVIANSDGTILAAHCTCMAGLGETCTHVGALLFWIEAAVKIRNSKTVTQSPAYWLLPSGIQKVTYDEVRDIDFTSASTKKCRLDESITTPPTPTTPTLRAARRNDVPTPSKDEVNGFLRRLHESQSKSVLLSLMPGYAEHFKPASLSVHLPKVLSELYNEEYVGMTEDELHNQCDIIFDDIIVTASQAAAVEERTRRQASSKDWFRFRSGRITASRLHAVCHTNPEKPSLSVIKSVCYPESLKFRSKATDWGCQHEKSAIDAYCNVCI
ncbi:uncharacterized protein LOC132557634 [Ylistrum balloti]|uniref:uncharacterized protein LOC132557634 n=1 Tax=Ylistrum balloti TaxID=509963 RepID=UPI002905A8EA|nr:uncharacterized protein LOC132557634 [Ylistrum balloti]